MTFRVVQLSDIHFGQERDGSRPRHDDVRRQLIADAGGLAEKRGTASMVLVVGDVAFAGKKEEYDKAGLWLDELTKAVRCNEKSVRIVPGNHDCDREKVKTACKTLHRQIRESQTAAEADNFLHKIAQEEEPNPFLQKLNAYHDFASSYHCEFQSSSAPLWWHDLDLDTGVKLRLIGLNSVQVCDEEDAQGKMVLGQAQYTAIADAAHILPVVLVHHPLHWFLDKTEAEPYLHNRVHLMLVGHEHISKIERVETATHERIDVYSGATNPSETGPLYRHTYNWIELSLLHKKGTYFLRVEIFARAWMPELTRFAADTARLGGKDSVVYEIACPLLKPVETASDSVVKGSESPGATAQETAVELPSSTKVTQPAPPTPSSNAEATGASEANGGAVMPAEEDVSQLRFLFWRYLDWRQRLKVLVEADVLPPTAEKPVSQNLERMAIEKARVEGKLAAVWDSMMPLLAQEKRRPNPFSRA